MLRYVGDVLRYVGSLMSIKTNLHSCSIDDELLDYSFPYLLARHRS